MKENPEKLLINALYILKMKVGTKKKNVCHINQGKQNYSFSLVKNDFQKSALKIITAFLSQRKGY